MKIWMRYLFLCSPLFRHLFWSSHTAGFNAIMISAFCVFQDIGQEIDKLCSFLGLSPSAEEKKSILEKGQFDKMKVNNMVNLKTFCEMDFKASSFIRKGIINTNIYNKIKFSLLHQLKCVPVGYVMVLREGWWLEEPFHCGPEWRVWWRLQEKNGDFYTGVSYYSTQHLF